MSRWFLLLGLSLGGCAVAPTSKEKVEPKSQPEVPQTPISKPAPEATQSNGRRAGDRESEASAVSSGALEGRVRQKLATDPELAAKKLSVVVIRGTVYLNGVVDLPWEKGRAAELATQVAGIKKVINRIVVTRQIYPQTNY